MLISKYEVTNTDTHGLGHACISHTNRPDHRLKVNTHKGKRAGFRFGKARENFCCSFIQFDRCPHRPIWQHHHSWPLTPIFSLTFLTSRRDLTINWVTFCLYRVCDLLRVHYITFVRNHGKFSILNFKSISYSAKSFLGISAKRFCCLN